MRPALARVAQRLGVTLADIDAHMTVGDALDEYLFDVDNAPADRAPR